MSIAKTKPGRISWSVSVGIGFQKGDLRPSIPSVDIMPFKVADPHIRYPAPIDRVDRANAIRLLKALAAAGANSNSLMVSAWLCDIALKLSLRGTELASALAYAERQSWIAEGPQKGWKTITHAGERAARLYVVGLY